MDFIETLYGQLIDEGRVAKIVDLTSPFNHTSAHYFFNHNIARALMLPTLVYGPDSDDDWTHSDSLFLHQASIIQIITSLESYYQLVFQTLAKALRTSQVDAVALSRFIRGNKLLVEFTNAMESQESLDFCIYRILPKYYTFQEKDKIKLAMTLFGVDPIGRFDQEWANTFGGEENSTANLRHIFVHKGTDFDWQPTKKIIHDKIKDAIVLAAYVDGQVVEKYKKDQYPDLYPEDLTSK